METALTRASIVLAPINANAHVECNWPRTVQHSVSVPYAIPHVGLAVVFASIRTAAVVMMGMLESTAKLCTMHARLTVLASSNALI